MLMNQPLEDHVGSIMRKAREAHNLSLSQAAAMAGLSEAAYASWEQTGQGESEPDWRQLAGPLGLDPVRLEWIHGGWKPQPVNLDDWREIRVITTERDGSPVHCYLVWDEVTRAAALFDTGWSADPVLEWIRRLELDLQHLYLTHTHEDHLAGMAALRARFPKIKLHTNAKSAPVQHRNRSQDFVHLGSLRISNRATPGHAEDGVIYVVGNWPEDAPHVAIVGDTIFAGSLATGFQSLALLRQSVREQIFSLPDTTLLCPGHGPLTTVGEERRHNPFFPGP